MVAVLRAQVPPVDYAAGVGRQVSLFIARPLNKSKLEQWDVVMHASRAGMLEIRWYVTRQLLSHTSALQRQACNFPITSPQCSSFDRIGACLEDSRAHFCGKINHLKTGPEIGRWFAGVMGWFVCEGLCMFSLSIIVIKVQRTETNTSPIYDSPLCEWWDFTNPRNPSGVSLTHPMNGSHKTCLHAACVVSPKCPEDSVVRFDSKWRRQHRVP